MPKDPDEIIPPASDIQLSEGQIKQALEAFATGKRRKTDRFVLAALSSIPWVGGLLGAASALDAEAEQGQVNALHREWLEEHKRRLGELASDLHDVMRRIEQLGPEAEKRLDDESYLALVRKGFGVWDASDTREKREYVRRLLSNAAGTNICSDDVLRLFLQWIDYYHELHFQVIRVIYKEPGATRAQIGAALYGAGRIREDSAEADLFKLAISDLNIGRVIRQHRDKTAAGEYLRKTPARTPKGMRSPVLKSAFDDVEPYELTELGKQFVHYVMSDVVPRVGPGGSS
jgi:hypothetical protein